MPLDITPDAKIATFTGPPFISIILNWGLFGVVTIQVYMYFMAFPNDRRMLKLLVTVVYLLDIAQTFLMTNSVWNQLVSGFGNNDGLDKIGSAWLSVCTIGGLVGFLSQWFYAYRIAVISEKRVIPAFILLMSLTALAGSLASAGNSIQASKFSNLLGLDKSKTFTVIGIWGGTSAVCDVVIAACMCYYLYRRTEHGRFTQTEAAITRLIRMTTETGILTASVSLLTLILYFPPSLNKFIYYVVPLAVHAKFYSTTMLSVLNSRIKFGITSESTTWRDSELRFAPPQNSRSTHAVDLDGDGVSMGMENGAGPMDSIGTSSRADVFVMQEKIVVMDGPGGEV